MTAVVYSESQRAMASILLSRSATWTHGRRKSDGTPFVIFESSRQNADGSKVGYMCRLDGRGCTCKGYLMRGGCSHSLAVTLYREQVPADWSPISESERAIEAAFLARVKSEPAAPRRVEWEREECFSVF